MIETTMDRLRALHGSWHGHGRGRYPTIDAFEYRESLRFEYDGSYPMLYYEQRTWLAPAGTASHWESGFIRVLEDGTVEISNSQDSGRVEVLTGGIEPGKGELQLAFASVLVDHDPRVVETRRFFTLTGDRLHYRVEMATRTTPEPKVQLHLEAELTRGTAS